MPYVRVLFYCGYLTHFNHPKIIGYCNRPFSCVEEMDTVIIDKWNGIVSPGDTVYHLGDFAFGKMDVVKRYRYRLNGKINLILGNHDYRNKIPRLAECFTSVKDIYELKHNHKSIILCHYAMRVWPKKHHGAIHLYGHSHGNLENLSGSMDVGTDTNNFTPYSLDEIYDNVFKGKHI